MSTLIIRKDAKQGWSKAARQTMLDSFERLAEWAAALNEQVGWRKYAVESPTGAVVEQVEL
jgi:hypothetical protein